MNPRAEHTVTAGIVVGFALIAWRIVATLAGLRR